MMFSLATNLCREVRREIWRGASRAIAALTRQTIPRRAIKLTVWGKADCSLCDRAHVIVGRVAQDYPLVVTYRDILEDQSAFDRYRYLIPVIEIEGGRHFEGKITEHWLRKGLDEISSG